MLNMYIHLLQILWLCRELVKNGAPGADSVCHSLVRQIAGGDVTQKNIWLTESMLDIFMDHRYEERKIMDM